MCALSSEAAGTGFPFSDLHIGFETKCTDTIYVTELIGLRVTADPCMLNGLFESRSEYMLP
jgi:hypothetical protein